MPSAKHPSIGEQKQVTSSVLANADVSLVRGENT